MKHHCVRSCAVHLEAMSKREHSPIVSFGKKESREKLQLFQALCKLGQTVQKKSIFNPDKRERTAPCDQHVPRISTCILALGAAEAVNERWRWRRGAKECRHPGTYVAGEQHNIADQKRRSSLQKRL